VAGATIRSKLALTASASNGVPSLKVTPWRRVKVNDVASGAAVHDSASHGLSSSVFGSCATSESTTPRVTSWDAAVGDWCGSRQPGSASVANVIVPPDLGCACGAGESGVVVLHATVPLATAATATAAMRTARLAVIFSPV
jgi:hypothetical protein